MRATGSPLNFLQQWYPVSPLEDLDPSRPTAVEVLGRRFVLWRPGGVGGTESFRAFLDLCPHRLAPLSQGRIDPDSGQLSCSYHGWQFDGDGLCRRIPQADPASPPPEQARHLCATAVPCRQAQDLLWLWPDPASAVEAEATPLPLSDRVDAAAGYGWSSVVRDLPYDWQTLVENVADPAHVPFAHHGVQGNRERAAPLPIRMLREEDDLLEAEVSGSSFSMTTRIRFRPPALLEYAFDLPGDRRMALVTYCVPTGPGRSRLVAQFPRNFALRPLRLIPRWWDHATNRNAVLDGDAVLLHLQEQELRRRRRRQGEPLAWQQAYRLPTASDRLVIAFRRWLERSGPLPWQDLPSAPAEASAAARPELLLDRYHQHTVHCSSCRGALAAIQRLQAAGVATFSLTLALAALLPDASRLSLGLPLVLLGVGALAGSAALRFGLEPRFRHLPYDHSRR